MDIKNLPPDASRPTPAVPPVPVSPVRSDERQTARFDREPAAEDRVEISDEGRSRARQADSAAENVPSGTLPADRLVALRRAIQDGAQNSDEIIASIARRIAERGDV